MKTKTIARFAMLTALALVLGYLESLIPIAPTIPGIKLGLGNTVLLYAVYMASPLESAMLMVCKVALSSLMFGGGFSAMLYSLAGGILSLAVMLLLVRLPKVGVIGVSACGAICHNLGQIAMASLILGVGAVWAYFPILVISGLVMGPITGAVAKSVFAALKKSGTEFYINPKTFQESKATDIIIISVMLVLSGGAWLAMSSNGLNFGNVASSRYYLEVVQNADVLYEIPMTAYGTYEVKNSETDGDNVFVIDSDGAYMESASCPDKICVNEGTITGGSTVPVTCLPNKLTMQVIPASALPDGFDFSAHDYTAAKIK
jgi:heptaprenyl diphosphate synthase